MISQTITPEDVIEKTREVVSLLTSREYNSLSALLDKQFVWLGESRASYVQGIPAFLEHIQNKSCSFPVEICEEEYSLLSHDRSLWVTYGRFADQSDPQNSKVHFSFVWKKKKDRLLLLMASVFHIKGADEPSEVSERASLPLPRTEKDSLLVLRDASGSIRYLPTSEILYFEAKDKVCSVHTTQGSFTSRITLKELDSPPFLRLHKSYLVNPAYLQKICRYQATLLNGSTLPIGKSWYMQVKTYLSQNSRAKISARGENQ